MSIDDAEEEVLAVFSDNQFDIRIVDPNDTELAKKLAELLPTASLILLDQKFNNDIDPLSLKASDGSSFVAHLRSWSRQNAKALAPVVLFTNDEQAFLNEIPAVGAALPLNASFVGREHQIAPALDVESIQLKAADDAENKIGCLVDAVSETVAAAGKNGVSLGELEDLLELPTGKVWTDKARSEIRAARPPISQIDETTADPFGSSQIVRGFAIEVCLIPDCFFPTCTRLGRLACHKKIFRVRRTHTGYPVDYRAVRYTVYWPTVSVSGAAMVEERDRFSRLEARSGNSSARGPTKSMADTGARD